MCEALSEAVRQSAISRRGMFSAGSALAAAGLVAGSAGPAATRPTPSGSTGRRTELVLLGTAGGPVWWPGSEREGIG
ncbi:hypothetical protein [Nocardioides currus]|uniref:hypothetical protein n=1 Tax=Nocardioides currus TaxID=2133958 RepID=UPI0010575492|nr:hypothetical protein [Nocardioides currus]